MCKQQIESIKLSEGEEVSRGDQLFFAMIAIQAVKEKASESGKKLTGADLVKAMEWAAYMA